MWQSVRRWKYLLLPARVALPMGQIKRIVVLRRGAIGDVLMTTPAIRGLRSRYPHAEIVVRTTYPELFELNPHVDRAQRSVRYAAFDMWVWMKYEDRLPLHEHIIECFCRCAGVPPQGRELDLVFSAAEQQAMDARLREFGDPLVTLQPWAGPWTRNKDWLPDRWTRVVDAIRSDFGATVIQLGSAGEPAIPGAVDWRGQTTLREAALTIRAARCHLGCDSSGQHFAKAVGTPAVVLYGTTHPACTGYAEQCNLYGGETPTPCYHRAACDHREAMRRIRVDDVLAAVHRRVHSQDAAARDAVLT